MKRLIVLCAAIGALCLASVPALAGQTAFTVRPTALKDRHYSDAKTLLTLPQDARVEIIGRHGSWNHVKTGGRTGWVKMLSLRLGSAFTGYNNSDNGFRTLFNVAANGGNAATTTGVRGLSEAKLLHPHPAPQQLQQMHRLQVGAAEAERFAKHGKLVTQQMGYLPTPAK